MTKPSARVLLLSPVDLSTPPGGRAMLGRMLLLLLGDLLGDRLVHVRPTHGRSPARGAWRGHVDGVDAALLDTLIATISDERITQMVVDGSNFGAAVAAVKARAPQVRIVTLFHNVEARFFWGAVRARPGLKSLAVLAANYVAERKAVRASDVLVTLSARDSAGLRRLYGREGDAVLPMVLEDKAPAPCAPRSPRAPIAPYALFVGGGFYANIAGIRWYLRAVAPRVTLPVRVVGHGMEAIADECARTPNATLVGAVDDLAPHYRDAACVIAPIFDGSGMKTKVAEALMFGKHVIGTPEAFSGYADDVVAANWCCTDADGFVVAITQALANPAPSHDPAMRALYERDHAPAAARRRLAAILGLQVSAA